MTYKPLCMLFLAQAVIVSLASPESLPASPINVSPDKSSLPSQGVGQKALPTIISTTDNAPKKRILKGASRKPVGVRKMLKGSKSKKGGKSEESGGTFIQDIRETVEGEGKGKGMCFHSSSEVQLFDGSIKRIDQIEVGDKVASVDDEGELCYVDVVYLPHLQNDDAATFLEIQCSSDEATQTSIQVTEKHFLFVSTLIPSSFADAVALPADKIIEGDWLWILNESGDLKECSVTNIGAIQDRSVYSAFTNNGRLIVNGVVASSYAERTKGFIYYDHRWAHLAMFLHRSVYQLGAADSFWFRSLNDNILAPLLA